MANWSKDEVRKRIQGYTNEKLLEEALLAAGGDDYDGGWTNYGVFEYSVLHTELYTRLADWLKEDVK